MRVSFFRFGKQIQVFSLFLLFVAHLPIAAFSESATKEWDLKESWVLSPKQAYLLKQKGAVLLDARDLSLRYLPKVADTKTISWEELSVKSSPNNGKLLSDQEILGKLSKVGIGSDTTVIVIGDPLNGWGEEGRIVWTLRTVGIKKSFWIDGGAKAYTRYLSQVGNGNSETNKGLEIKQDKNAKKKELDIDHSQLKSALNAPNKKIFVLDVREEREFKGETPYGESRGGHIPGAKWLYFKSFLNQEGYLKSKEEILSVLTKESIPKNGIVVSYCTGGIRSAWTTSVLISYGIEAKNYSGSMWEWSSLDSKEYPLVK
ncbi:sulfurtransferase [Leptospira idonii]|nr:rhodanese-like domain-containing protein [Leptospira idonii]